MTVAGCAIRCRKRPQSGTHAPVDTDGDMAVAARTKGRRGAGSGAGAWAVDALRVTA